MVHLFRRHRERKAGKAKPAYFYTAPAGGSEVSKVVVVDDPPAFSREPTRVFDTAELELQPGFSSQSDSSGIWNTGQGKDVFPHTSVVYVH